MVSPEEMVAALEEIARAARELNTGKITGDQYDQIKAKYPFVDTSDIIGYMMDGVDHFAVDFSSKKTRRKKAKRGLLRFFHFPIRKSRRTFYRS